MEGADIYQIAKNCRTSVEMIEKYYAAHIKTNLDASAINVMRPKTKKETETNRKIKIDQDRSGKLKPAPGPERGCKFARPAL